MNINWYPGHMKKTREGIERNLSLVDIVFELIDARIPYSSQNPIIDEILKSKSRIIVLNKMDLASEEANLLWSDYFKSNELSHVFIDSIKGKGIDRLLRLTSKLTADKRKQYRDRGVINKPTRVMIIGIPNVGKSTLINTLSGRKGTRTGNKPGITKANQWIKIRGGMELLDTPGILWPKFEEKEVGLNLAYIGSIKDEIIDIESLAIKLLEKLKKINPQALENRYNISIDEKTPLEIMEEIGKKRGCIVRGGEVDYTKASEIILDEFRKGIIGNISLELPRNGGLND